MKNVRRDASTFVFVVAVATILSGWGAALTHAGATLIWFGVGAALVAAALYPSLPRVVIAGVLAAFHLFWLPGLAAALGISAVAIAVRRVGHRGRIPPPSPD